MRPFTTRRSRPALRRQAAVVALLAAVSVTACGGADENAEQAASSSDARTSAPSSSPTSGEQGAGASHGTPIRITVGDTELTGRLLDNATARDLGAQLPLTLTFRDHNNVEKTAPLPRKLSLSGAPAGHDPAAGDISYWAPDGDLVLYYDDQAPFWNGIVRIGEFDGAMDAVRRLPDGARVSIELAG
ncbi:MAG TPA: cyclophilin-like fold protein [Actinoallomurus sp.]